MSLTDWENSVVAAAAVRSMAEQLLATPGYSLKIVQARHGLEALARVIESAEPAIPPHQLSALIDLISLGVNHHFSGVD